MTHKSALPGYSATHYWVYRYYGKANHCVECTKPSKRFEWANISGEYKRDISDWMQMCTSCHKKFDFTEETRKKFSDAKLGIVLPHMGKAVKQLDKDGNVVNTYRSIKIASGMTGVSRTSISNSLSGLSKTAGGFKWIKAL